MVRAYSLDLRERVVAAVEAGQSGREVAETFMVSVSSVVKWSQRCRATGSAAALKMGGHRPYVVAREKDWLIARIAEKPDLTLRALVAELAERGWWRAITARSGVFFSTKASPSKKSLHASEQDRPDVARRRRQWKTHQGDARSGAAGLHRRDLGQDQHDAHARALRHAASGWSPRCRTATGEP